MNIRLFRSCSVPIWICSPELHVQDTCFLHEVQVMERYVTTVDRLYEIHKCAQGSYVTTTYHLYKTDEKYCSICI